MKLLKKIIMIIIISILSLFLIINLVIVINSIIKPNEIPSLFGYKPFIVMSGSMESNISVGDLVIVKEIEPSTLENGDIIAFRDGDIVITHRIVGIENNNNSLTFKTKGDANNVEDKGIVFPKNIEGKFLFKISKLGTVILAVQEPLGFTVMILSIIIICLLFYNIENRKVNYISDEEKAEFEKFKKEKSNEDN